MKTSSRLVKGRPFHIPQAVAQFLEKDQGVDKELPMRILCLDVGAKRIGVASTDPFGWMAQPVTTIERRGKERDLKAIEKLCREMEVEHLLIGLPLDQEGELGEAAKKIERFAERLNLFLQKVGYVVPLEFWDERYSTTEAEERLIEVDMSRAKRRKIIDKMAAVVILESYLREKGGER